MATEEAAPTRSGGTAAAGGFWGRDKKNARVWVESATQQQPHTVQSYVEGVQAKAKQADQHRVDEWRVKRPYVLSFKNITPRPESSMTARSNVSLASSIAFSNNPWANTPRIGGTHVYTRVGSVTYKAKSFEPADNYYERTQPPNIPHTSTNQGARLHVAIRRSSIAEALGSPPNELR
jgi:hypothetical protein